MRARRGLRASLSGKKHGCTPRLRLAVCGRAEPRSRAAPRPHREALLKTYAEDRAVPRAVCVQAGLRDRCIHFSLALSKPEKPVPRLPNTQPPPGFGRFGSAAKIIGNSAISWARLLSSGRSNTILSALDFVPTQTANFLATAASEQAQAHDARIMPPVASVEAPQIAFSSASVEHALARLLWICEP